MVNDIAIVSYYLFKIGVGIAINVYSSSYHFT
jgi:hypothetical protein